MTSPLSAMSSMLPAAPAAAAKPADTDSAGSEPSAFARELSRAQDAEPQPPQAVKNSKPAARGKAAAEPAEAATTPNAEAVASTPRPADGSEADDGEPAAEGAPAGDLSAMINNLLGLSSPPAPPPGTAAAAAPAGSAQTAQEGVALTATAGKGAGELANLHLPAATDVDTRAAGPAGAEAGPGARAKADAGGTVPTTTELQSTAADQRASAPADGRVPLPPALEMPVRAGTEPTPAPTAALPGLSAPAAPAAATSSAPATATPFEARLSAALGSIEFAPAFGQQVRVLVQDGVQHARLHINPAELGPITVQIALDGMAAQVHLAAEQPLTRQALEQAMPVLAGALREGGLTLSGGGVFEQPRDPQRDGSGAPAGGSRRPADSRAEDGGAGANASIATRRLRGAVDLIA